MTDKCYELESQGRKQYFFVAKYKSGELGKGTGDEMTNVNYEKYGFYIPEIIPKDETKNIKLLPLEIKENILRNLDEIFKKTVFSNNILILLT